MKKQIEPITRIWADAQRDGRPAVEYRWCRLRKFRNSIPCATPQTFADDHWSSAACSNAANIGERKTWTQNEFCTWQNSGTG